MANKPEWLTQQGLFTLQNGYLDVNEDVEQMFKRISNTSSSLIKKMINERKQLGFDVTEIQKYTEDYSGRLFSYLWNNWLCLASPVATNFGNDRGLPISCFGIDVSDSMDGIGKANHELMMLTKAGGGVGIDGDKIRPRNSEIRNGRNGKSEGSIPFFKIFDSTILASNQGSTRRGACVINQSITHGDNEEFMRIRRPQGDVDRQCLNVHHAVKISDEFMNRVEEGDELARHKWIELMRTRYETGEPYILYMDNINNSNPQMYKDKGINVNQSNLCTEITLLTDAQNSFVCCLSSLNLTKYEDWKNDEYFLFDCILFLDTVIEETILKCELFKKNSGYDRILKFAKENRALGLGVLGWHSLLQMKNLPFDTSWEVMRLNSEIFQLIKQRTDHATRLLASWLGEPSMCAGYGVRHTHRLAIAPTVTNSRISGGVSAGIEPINANAFADKGAKGTFFFKNPQLEKLFESKNKNTDEVWKSIVENEGSVQHLDFLTEKEKDIYLTAREMNQMNIITQAAQRQQFIDQAQSINLFFPANVNPKYFHKVHFEAWKSGIKTLYYCKTSSVLKGDIANRYYDDTCKSCEG